MFILNKNCIISNFTLLNSFISYYFFSLICLKDNIIHLDLLRTQRARFLSEVYKDMQRKVNRSDRLELLAKVKRILLDEREYPDFGEVAAIKLLQKLQKLQFFRFCNFSSLI